MSTIKIEIDSEDVIALRAAGEVFAKIADEMEVTEPVTEVPADTLDEIRELLTDPELTVDGEYLNIHHFVNGRKAGEKFKISTIIDEPILFLRSIQLSVIELKAIDAEEQAEVSTPVPPVLEQVASIDVEEITQAEINAGNLPPVTNTTVGETGITATDVNGLPWDARIHAGSKANVKDGSWKMRKKPADTTPEEWNDFIVVVTNELNQLMSITVPTTKEEEVTPSSFDAPVLVPPVVIPPVPATPVVCDPKSLNVPFAPPVPPVLAGSTPVAVEAVEFKDIMKLCTTVLIGRMPEINITLNELGIEGANPVALLSKRPDLFVQAHAALKGLIGA